MLHIVSHHSTITGPEPSCDPYAQRLAFARTRHGLTNNTDPKYVRLVVFHHSLCTDARLNFAAGAPSARTAWSAAPAGC